MGLKKRNDSKRNFYIPYQYNIIFIFLVQYKKWFSMLPMLL